MHQRAQTGGIRLETLLFTEEPNEEKVFTLVVAQFRFEADSANTGL
jgi:hypothetical protein